MYIYDPYVLHLMALLLIPFAYTVLLSRLWTSISGVGRPVAHLIILDSLIALLRAAKWFIVESIKDHTTSMPLRGPVGTTAGRDTSPLLEVRTTSRAGVQMHYDKLPCTHTRAIADKHQKTPSL